MKKLTKLGNSQKKLLMGLVLIFVITISIRFILLRKKSVETPIQVPITAETKTKSPLLEDPDNDGLMNWEEELYKTNPQNPDTDRDGTPDNEELKLGRDPSKAGPHDTIAEIKKEETAARAQTIPNLTQSLFEDFIKQGGAESLLLQKDPERASQLMIEKVLEYQQSGKLPVEIGDLSELPLPAIHISKNTSEETIKKYLNDVWATFEEELTPLYEDDLRLFLAMLQSGNFDRINKLKNYALAIERITRKMRLLTAPQNLAWFHAKEIRYLEITWRDVQKLANIDKDPLNALLAVSTRKNTKIAMLKLHYEELKEWLNKNKIVLQPQDKAYRLVN